MNCKNCGAPLPDGARFCKKCGTEAPTEQPVVRRSGWTAKLNEGFGRIAASVKKFFSLPVFHDTKKLMMIGGGIAALILVLILILSIASCSRQKLRTPDDVQNAVLEALESGDGDALCALASLSEEICGAHPEVFGEGKDAHAVMLNYYRTLAGSHQTQWKETYGKRFRLEAQTETELLTLSPIDSGSELYEINRALNIDATQYAKITGPVLIDGETVADLAITAVEWDGEWRLLVVYLL